MQIILPIAVILNILLIIFFDNSKQFDMFGLWLAIFTATNIFVVIKLARELKFSLKLYIRKYWKGLLITLFIAFVPRLLLLGIYPHVSVYDELRDGGLLAQRFDATNNQTQIFGFGAYEGYGNFIPLSVYPFLKLFGASFLAYIVPATLYGAVALVLLYLIIAAIKGQRFAVLSTALASVVLINLHFSRTELCLITDALIAMVILLGFILSRKHKLGFFFYGVAAGLTWHYYAGSRAILLCFLIITAVIEIKALINAYNGKRLKIAIRRLLVNIAFALVGVFITLGPTLLYFKPTTLLSQTAANYFVLSQPEFAELNYFEKFIRIIETYFRSFGFYFAIPEGVRYFAHSVNFHRYPYALLTFPVNIFFLIGVFATLLKKKNFILKAILAVVFLYPIFSQVIINKVGYIHRQVGITAFLSIIAFVGFQFVVNKLLPKFKWKQWIIYIFVAGFYISQLIIYFGGRLSDIAYESKIAKEYVFQEALFDIEKESDETIYVILDAQPYTLTPLLYREKAQYLTSPKKVFIVKTDKFLEKLNQALYAEDNMRYKFIYFDSKASFLQVYQGRIASKTNYYKCHNNYFGTLYDCPSGMTGYNYYYFEL